MSSKPIVKYDTTTEAYIRVGHSAIVQPIDHPSDWVSNTQPVRTSKVVSHDPKTGSFETANTIYVPDH